VINIDRGSNTVSVLVEMLSKAWPQWTFNNSDTHLSSMGSLFMTQMWTETSFWKYLIGLIKDKLRNRHPMDGEGDELQQKKNCQFLLFYFEDCYRAKFGAKAFHFREGPAPTCQSTLHNLEGTTFSFLCLLLFLSHLKSEWPPKYLKVLYANKGSILSTLLQIFDRLHSSLLISWQVPQITEGSIKDRPFFCTELSPGFTLITYSIKDRLF